MDNIYNYINKYKQTKLDGGAYDKKVKIAILTSFTMQGIKETIFLKCLEEKIYPDIYLCDYKQYSSEIYNEESGLYKFKPDIIILFVDLMSFMGESYFDFYGNVTENNTDNRFRDISNMVEKIKSKLHAKIILHNFCIPTYSPLGILETKKRDGFFNWAKNLNKVIEEHYIDDKIVFVFDYDLFCSKVGKENILDYKLYYLGDIKLSFNYIPRLCDEYLGYIRVFCSVIRKCIVLDLDNTLWGGIVGEDGINGIALGPDSKGRPFWEFQKYLYSLSKRGTILAINSKNNYEDAINVLRNHPFMVLKEENFAHIKINWDDKVTNMRKIAVELNIGLDSIVFIDDDKLNREFIKAEMPEIFTVELPENPMFYSKCLKDLNIFNTMQLTDEDIKKSEMYIEQKERNKFRESLSNYEDYLNGLQMEISIQEANDFNIPRIAQLTQKTNQFNMTTRRYTEQDIKKFADDDNTLVFCVSVKDKFGDNGITGAAICKFQNKNIIIDTFLLSCRVIGRNIEKSMLSYILDYAKDKGMNNVIGEFIPTQKNKPAEKFFEQNGFKYDSQGWVLKIIFC